MSLSMYQASIPLFIRGLENLAGILRKAAAHAEAKKIAPNVFLNARLAPDMFARNAPSGNASNTSPNDGISPTPFPRKGYVAPWSAV